MSYRFSAGDNIKDLLPIIESEYNINIGSLKEIEKGSLIAHTDRDRVLISEIDEKENYFIFICGIYEYLKNKGFQSIFEMYDTKSGKYYIKSFDKLYTLCRYSEGMDILFELDNNPRDIIKLLAAFHRNTQGYSPPPGGKCKSDWGKWIEKYRKQYKTLYKYFSRIKEKEKNTEFEKELLKNHEYFLKRMEKSIEILNKKGYIDLVEESMKKRQICLGSFKKHSFYEENGCIKIRTLNKCRYDIVEKDIALLLEKIFESKKSKHSKEILKLIEIYNNENTLNRNSIDIIKAFLLFPEEYEKICSKYMKDKDKWTESKYIERLRNAVKYEKKKIELIDSLDNVKL